MKIEWTWNYLKHKHIDIKRENNETLINKTFSFPPSDKKDSHLYDVYGEWIVKGFSNLELVFLSAEEDSLQDTLIEFPKEKKHNIESIGFNFLEPLCPISAPVTVKITLNQNKDKKNVWILLEL